MPQPNEVRVSKDGREAVWTGSQWMIMPNPSAGVPSGRTDTQDFSTFKNAATSLGALASLFLPEVGIPARVAASVIGGAGARGTASAMTGGNVPADVAEGAMAGGAQEAAPLAVGPALKYGGKGLQKLASIFGVGDSGTSAAVGAGTRAFLAHELGLGPEGVAGAVVGPPAARAVGVGAEKAGDALAGKTTSQHILGLIDRVTGRGADAAETVAPRTIDPNLPLYKQMEELPDPSRKIGPSRGFNSGRTNTPPYQTPPTPAAMRPRVVGKTPTVNSVLDDALTGLRGEKTPAPLGDTPTVRSVERGNLVPAAERSGAPSQRPSLGMSEDELHNINRNAPYGEGGLIAGPLPTEYRPLSLQGLEDAAQPTTPGKIGDAEYYMITGQHYLPESSVVEDAAERQVKPGASDVDEMLNNLSSNLESVPSAGQPRQPELPSSWQQFSSGETGTRATAPEIDLPDSLKAIDKSFGPGATDMEGAPFQSTSGFKGANNLLYDPQTPSDYLREQLSSASDPAEQDFLARALRQRMRVGTSRLNLTGTPQ